MRNILLIFCAVIATLGLTAFGVMIWNTSELDQKETQDPTQVEPIVNDDIALNSQNVVKPDESIFSKIFYDVGPRFAPLKKVTLQKVRTINDFFDKEEMQEIVSLTSVTIISVKHERPMELKEIGYSNELNEAQLKLLQSFDYSSNFSVRANFKKMNSETGKLEDSFYNPYITIVPEKQAEYANGKDALNAYLKENSKENLRAVKAKKLRPAKLYFTVTKEGTIENVRLDNHTGYPKLDKKMIELISKTPGLWTPAENAKGEKVNQELVISIGIIGMGC